MHNTFQKVSRFAQNAAAGLPTGSVFVLKSTIPTTPPALNADNHLIKSYIFPEILLDWQNAAIRLMRNIHAFTSFCISYIVTFLLFSGKHFRLSGKHFLFSEKYFLPAGKISVGIKQMNFLTS
jgi:cyclopropane fatty-acyl-phospholipid synthase-like methyltransferase